MLGEKINILYKKYHKIYSDITIIPFNDISDEPAKYFMWYTYEIQKSFADYIVFAEYISKYIILYKENMFMAKYKVTINIPYNKRDEYISVVFELNKCVSTDGVCMLFVNNNPYEMSSYLCIEDNMNNCSKIEAIINNAGLVKDNSIGLHELILELQNRRYNAHCFGFETEYELFKAEFQQMYFFASEKDLAEKGYSLNRHLKKNKVFISYCHANKTMVYDIVDKLENSGLNLWIDKKNIDVGNNILSSIFAGIKESNFSILFLSKATIDSNYSKLELENIMAEMIKKEMGWYIVKIDDVNVDEILPSLSNYKYFDLTLQSADELIEDIIKCIEKLNI